MKRNSALFLDRDGVINVDNAYVHRIEDFEFIDGIFELCEAAQMHGYLIIVVTNQAGIGRGYYSEEDFHKLSEWMCRSFEQRDIVISDIYFCPYHPEHGIGIYKQDSSCRKPRPGMLLRAKDEHSIDMDDSIFIGDKLSDLEAGEKAGVGLNILFSRSHKKSNCITVVSDLVDVINIIKDKAKI